MVTPILEWKGSDDLDSTYITLLQNKSVRAGRVPAAADAPPYTCEVPFEGVDG